MRQFSLLILIFLLSVASGSAQNIHSYAQVSITPPGADDGELLIDFGNEEPVSKIDSLLAASGLSSNEFSWFSQDEKWIRIKGLSPETLERIKSNADVEDIEPNYYMTAFSIPNDPYYKYQWHLDQIGMKTAWDFPQGAPVTVAVIDTGIAYENYQNFFKVEDLAPTQFVDPYNFVANTSHANDDHGHGTHVAGTIAQWTNNGVGAAGVAPNVRLMPLKVLTSAGYGTIADIARAIRYAADHGAAVINMSLGGPFPSLILHKAIRYAHDKGVVVVCAAGNGGRSGLSYPAAYSECISVAAVRFDGSLSWYSSFGKGLTIAAPGGDMNVDQNGDGLMDGVLQNTLNPQDPSSQGYFLFQGTSMATPHVAAVAALLVSHGVTDPEKVRSILEKSAQPVKDGDSDHYGAGLLRADRALNSINRRNLRVLGTSLIIAVILTLLLNRKRNAISKLNFNGWSIAGLLLGATGLFFLGKWFPLSRYFLVTHPIAEWQFAFFGFHSLANPIFFSVLPAFALLILFYPWKRLAPLVSCFAIGSGTFLLFAALQPITELAWIPGAFLQMLWLGLNGILCLVVFVLAALRVR